MQLVEHGVDVAERLVEQAAPLVVHRVRKLPQLKRRGQKLLRHAVVKLARDAPALVFLGGNRARKVASHNHASHLAFAFDVVCPGRVKKIVRDHAEVAKRPAQIAGELVKRAQVVVVLDAKGAQEHPHDAPLLRDGQRAQAAQILGEHDGIGGIFARVELAVDVGEHHGLAGFQHDSADPVPGGQHDAAVAVARVACAVEPLERRAGKCGEP